MKCSAQDIPSLSQDASFKFVSLVSWHFSLISPAQKEDANSKNGKQSKKRKQTDLNSTEESLAKRSKKESKLCKQIDGEEVGFRI